MRIPRFRSQPTIPFFAAVNHLILTDLLGNKTLLNRFKRSCFVICGFQSVLFFSVSRFVACDRNYDWRQRKTQLWRWLLKFRVRMFVKSAAKSQCSQRPLDQAGSMGSWLSVLVYFWFSYNTIFLSSVNQLSLSHFMLVERQQFLEFPVTSN